MQSAQSNTRLPCPGHQTANMCLLCAGHNDPASDRIDNGRDDPAMPTASHRKNNKRHTVAAIVGHGTSPFELAVACEVFGVDRSDDIGQPWYRFLVVAADEPPVRMSTGFSIDTPYRLDALRRADTVVVPAWAGGHDHQVSDQVLDAL